MMNWSGRPNQIRHTSSWSGKIEREKTKLNNLRLFRILLSFVERKVIRKTFMLTPFFLLCAKHIQV